jgi:hypothetical protein
VRVFVCVLFGIDGCVCCRAQHTHTHTRTYAHTHTRAHTHTHLASVLLVEVARPLDVCPSSIFRDLSKVARCPVVLARVACRVRRVERGDGQGVKWMCEHASHQLVSVARQLVELRLGPGRQHGRVDRHKAVRGCLRAVYENVSAVGNALNHALMMHLPTRPVEQLNRTESRAQSKREALFLPARRRSQRQRFGVSDEHHRNL